MGRHLFLQQMTSTTLEASKAAATVVTSTARQVLSHVVSTAPANDQQSADKKAAVTDDHLEQSGR